MLVIEEARAVLKKWRDAAPWLGGPVVNGGTPLIDGTAGNPDLLDAIDLGLAFYESEADITQVPEVTALIATAILRADKEMQK